MHAIVKSYLDSFIDSFGYDSSDGEQTKNFEKFCTYYVLKHEYKYVHFSSEDINSSMLGDYRGVDSISFMVNGKLVSSLVELQDLLTEYSNVSVRIFFIQTKTSEKFNSTDILNFTDTVKDFLNEAPEYPLTEEAVFKHEILKYIYEKFSKIQEFTCICTYCSTGVWDESNDAKIVIEKAIKEISEKTGVFNKGILNINHLDKNDIIRVHDKVNSLIEASFEFRNKIPIRELPDNVKQAYFGILPFSEFKKIIIDPETDELRNLFEDNVRDDLGASNSVNKKIASTIESEEFALFSLLNNGVTIIADNNHGTDDKIELTNFQVVNGCQTSNVLYRLRQIDGIDGVNIPLKLVITEDPDVVDSIVVATNNQTEIKEEQLMALSGFQKELEAYYKSHAAGIRYERRVNQYAQDNIKKKDIIDLREQIKAFYATFYEEPHVVSGYFTKTYNLSKTKLFQFDHKLEPYFLCGLLAIRFRELINKKKIERKYNKARYFIFMLFRKIFEDENFQPTWLGQKKVIDYSLKLISELDPSDEQKLIDKFNQAIKVIDQAEVDIENPKEMYVKSTTLKILDKYEELKDGLK